MATRIPRGGSDDAPADETNESSAPQTRAVRATRSASATNRLRRDAEEPVAAPETRAAKAVRASRANARAAAAAPAAGASRTVRIRPDSEPGDSLDEELVPTDDDASLETDPAVVVLDGRRPDPATTAAPASVGTPTSAGESAGEVTDQPAPPRRRAAPRPTSPPPVAAAEAPTAVVAPAAPVPAAAPPAPAAAASAAPEKADKPKERRPLPNVISIVRLIGDKIGLLAQLAGLIAFLVLAIHVLFVASDANANNAIVSWFDRRSNGLVGDFRNIFSAKTAKGRVFYNYGLAAVVYLLAGSLVRRILRK